VAGHVRWQSALFALNLTLSLKEGIPDPALQTIQELMTIESLCLETTVASQKPRKSVAVRGGRPGAGVRLSTRYSTPNWAQYSRLPPLSPSSFTA